MSNIKQNSLFNVKDQYSWSNLNCNCNTTFTEVGLNENIVLLPPITNIDSLVEINLPTVSSSIVDNDANPVIGVIRKPMSDHAPVLLANNVPSNASFQLLDAFGSLTQKNLTGDKVIPSNGELKVNNAITEIVKEVSKSEQEIASPAVVKEVQKEQINKEIVKSVQEVTTKVMESELGKQNVGKDESKKISENIAESVAEKTEVKLNDQPSEVKHSIQEVENITKKCVGETLKEMGMTEDECNKHAETISKETVALVQSNIENKPISEQKIIAEIIAIRPEVSNAVNETSKEISNVIESGSKISVNNEDNTVNVTTENKNVINNSIAKVLGEHLSNIFTENTSEVEKKVENNVNGTIVTLDLKNNNVSSALHESIGEQLTNNVVEKFINKLPERFSQFNTKYVNKSNHINVRDSNNKKIDLHNMIKSNIVEQFSNLQTNNIYKNVNNSTKRIIEAMENVNSANHIVEATAEITQNSTNNNNIKVETCTKNCNLNKPETAEAIASVVASRLAPINVTSVSVETNPKKENNVTVSAIVPNNVDSKHVANIIVDTVNKTSSVVKSNNGVQSNGKSSNKPDFLTIMIVSSIVLFVGYHLYKRL